MSKIEVDAIDKQSGSTLTLGGSGTAVTLASGATQTGFGRTGTVDWQTTIKTSGFTAVSGEGYFCNTTSGGFTVTLPASPSAGDIVSISDYAKTFDTNNLTIGRNSSNIGGQAENSVLSTEGIAITLVYADATKGWIVTESGLQSEAPGPAFISATGGTITTVCTNFKVHTFTGPGTFTVCSAGNSNGSNTVSYMVIAGGGGGGNWFYAGGGGAGGFRESKASSDSYTASPLNATSGPSFNLPVSAQGYPITVGAGGASPGTPPSPGQPGVQGGTSSFSTISSAGGGFGGARPGNGGCGPGGSGGSGGGGTGGPGPSGQKAGGTGNTPPVSPAQGTNGGEGSPGAQAPQGGLGGSGGGATAAGTQPTTNGSAPAAAGGAGATSSINGTPTTRAGGGGGGANACSSIAGGPGGAGGGGNGAGRGNSSPIPIEASAGTANTGGGGGGASHPCQGGCFSGKAGGSGIVIIRYRFQ
jgi:hypothetical protein